MKLITTKDLRSKEKLFTRNSYCNIESFTTKADEYEISKTSSRAQSIAPSWLIMSTESMSYATTPRHLAVVQGAGYLHLGEQHSLEHIKGRAGERWEALNSLGRAELFKCLSNYWKKTPTSSYPKGLDSLHYWCSYSFCTRKMPKSFS